jgi:hypothetical protein
VTLLSLDRPRVSVRRELDAETLLLNRNLGTALHRAVEQMQREACRAAQRELAGMRTRGVVYITYEEVAEWPEPQPAA